MMSRWVEPYQTEIRRGLPLTFPTVLIPIVLAYFHDWNSKFAPFQTLAIQSCLDGFNTFITGPAGSGKTFLLESIVQKLKAANQQVVVTALTGVAAVAVRGQTLHSFAKLMKLEQDGYPDLKQRDTFIFRQWLEIWSNVNVLVIDEISMMPPHLFSMLVQLWKDLGVIHTLQVILIGDFFQLPPVQKQNPYNTSEQTLNPSRSVNRQVKFEFCFETPEWNELVERNVYLYDVFRQSDQEFVRTLNVIRVGKQNAMDLERLQQRWVRHPNYRNEKSVFEFKSEYTWIFSTNTDADHHNRDILNTIHGERHVYKSDFGLAVRRGNPRHQLEAFDRYRSANDVREQRHIKYFHEPRHQQLFSTKPELELKVGVRVMLTVNMDTKHGLVNGACGTVIQFDVCEKQFPTYGNLPLPIVKFDNGVIGRICLHEWTHIVERSPFKNVLAYTFMVQLPLQYAYATTIHKSQGRTLKKLVLSLSRLFVDAQAYVALSRAQSLEDLHLLDAIHPRMFRVNSRVQRFYETIM